MIMDLGCDTFIDRYLTTLDSTFLRYFFLKQARKQGYSDPEMVYDTLSPKMCPQTKFGIPMSNNVGFMLVTRYLAHLSRRLWC